LSGHETQAPRYELQLWPLFNGKQTDGEKKITCIIDTLPPTDLPTFMNLALTVFKFLQDPTDYTPVGN